MANPTKPAEVTTSSTEDFSTSNQSMWGSGSAVSFNDSLTLFGISTGNIGLDAGPVSGSASLGASLVASLSGTSGDVGLDYPLDVSFTMPNEVAPGQQFTVQTEADGLDTSGDSPSLTADFPNFSASLDADFSGSLSASVDAGIFGSASFSGSFDTDDPLATVSSGQSKTALDGALTLSIPTAYYTAPETATTGSGDLPSMTLDVATSDPTQPDSTYPDVISVSTDLLSDLQSLLLPDLPLSGSFLDGAISYDLASLTLTAGIGLAQQFTFDPTDVLVDIKTGWGQSETVKLGQAATFTLPTNYTGPTQLTTTYELQGNLVDQLGVVGNVDLNLSLLSGSVLSSSFGPVYQHDFPVYTGSPVYLFDPGGSDGFSLEGFNSPTGSLSFGIGNGQVVLPGNITIDTSMFSANTTADIQTAIDNAEGSASATNIYDPTKHTGSATAVAGELNMEEIEGSGKYQLPTGFLIGSIEGDAGSAELDGNAGDVLLIAAPTAGHTDTLKGGGSDILLGTASGGLVDFVVTPSFTGEIGGLRPGDAIDIAKTPVSGVSLGAGNVLSVSVAGGPGFQIDLDPSQNFAGDILSLKGDGAGGSDVVVTAVIASGQSVTATAGEIETGLLISHGAKLTVLSGGESLDNTVDGTLTVDGGGQAVGTMLNTGGNETVLAGGTDTGGTVINETGPVTLTIFGTATDTELDDATVTIKKGGTLQNPSVEGGKVVDYGSLTGGGHRRLPHQPDAVCRARRVDHRPRHRVGWDRRDPQGRQRDRLQALRLRPGAVRDPDRREGRNRAEHDRRRAGGGVRDDDR